MVVAKGYRVGRICHNGEIRSSIQFDAATELNRNTSEGADRKANGVLFPGKTGGLNMNESGSMPRIDIVIAARNEAHHLGSCLDSLANQSYPRQLVTIYVVVDDVIGDRTAAVAQTKGAVVLQNSGRGPAAARNFGLRAGRGQLVGFLDAHCVAGPRWIELMVEALRPRDAGGCQGTFEYRNLDPLADLFTRHTMFSSDEALARHTVSGASAPYPWVVTGNCMYKREALAAAGDFAQWLISCEDTDLAWRVVLCGFRLTLVPKARVTHIDERPWTDFFRKFYAFGRGAAQLAYAYNLHGAPPRYHLGAGVFDFAPSRMAMSFAYNLGYRLQQARILLHLDAWPESREIVAISDELRPKFFWQESTALRLSHHVIYWFVEGDEVTVVDLYTARRFAFKDVAGRIILALGDHASREQTLEQLAATYDSSLDEMSSDLDEFIESLVAEGVIERL